MPALDEHGYRISLHPSEVRGRYRRRRNWFQAFLLIIFLVLPWIRIGGHQAVLLNIPERKFAIFGLTFWAHDAPMVFFVLATAALSLAFVTAIWGRVWCGWACPQTVFIEALFRRIDKWVEGNHLQRRRLEKQPWNPEKIGKRGLKWTLYVLAAMVISHSFLAYFVGTEQLAKMMISSPFENWTVFLIMAFITAVITFDFGWFREQFCIIMCPYGRFQSVLMDENSMAVLYDPQRGEPRKAKVKKGEPFGDCVSCNKCVSACPTGIDIRDGLQMECIACTACVDACDEVMEKIGKPHGLIRYETLKGLQGQKASNLRPRTFVYFALISVLIAGLTYQIATHQDLDVTAIRAIESPYQVKQIEGQEIVINHYKLHIKNQSFEAMTVQLSMTDPRFKMVTPLTELTVAGGQSEKPHIFIQFPKELLSGREKLKAPLKVKTTGEDPIEIQQELTLVGPLS